MVTMPRCLGWGPGSSPRLCDTRLTFQNPTKEVINACSNVRSIGVRGRSPRRHGLGRISRLRCGYRSKLRSSEIGLSVQDWKRRPWTVLRGFVSKDLAEVWEKDSA